MRQYTVKRVALFLPTVLLITIIVFVVMRMVPGDPALAILSEGDSEYTQEDLERLRSTIGTDRPVDVQYFDWIAGKWVAGILRCGYSFGLSCGYIAFGDTIHQEDITQVGGPDGPWATRQSASRQRRGEITAEQMLQVSNERYQQLLAESEGGSIHPTTLGEAFREGEKWWNKFGGVILLDFGDSLWFKAPVMAELKERIPVTIELAFMALIMSVAIAVPFGIVSAIKPEGPVDYGARIFTLVGIAVPNFIVAVGLILLLVWVGGLPPLGYEKPWDAPVTNLHQMIFPALSLALYNMAFIARVTRSSMMEILREDYMRTARSKGLGERVVVVRHGLKNAILPILTVSGWQFGRLFGGTVVIETIFLIPGMGKILIEGIFHRDYTLIQAEIVIIGVAIVTINLLVDLLYGLLDPRIRYA
jgi:peptide/nickel transport system permease protein